MDRLPPAPASPVLPGGLLHGLTAGHVHLDPVAVVLARVAADHEARW